MTFPIKSFFILVENSFSSSKLPWPSLSAYFVEESSMCVPFLTLDWQLPENRAHVCIILMFYFVLSTSHIVLLRHRAGPIKKNEGGQKSQQLRPRSLFFWD